MRPPCEVVHREFLPEVRTKLAKSLRNAGLSQIEIASRMNVTQAAVSKYLAQKSSDTELTGEINKLVDRLTSMVLNQEITADKIVKELCSACMYSRLGFTICKIHQKNIGSLKDANCQICSELLGGHDNNLSERAEVIRDMQDALYAIESSITFERIVPQVRANLVACHKTSRTIEDVAGVPGRITIVGGRALALIGPEFGASRHTAELLLRVRDVWPKTTACLCVSGHSSIMKAATGVGFHVVSTEEPEIDPSKIIHSLTAMKKLPTKNASCPAIHVPGGIGIEPILYLFGTSARRISEMCIQLSDSLLN
ncbi:MAG: hypothetical protein JW779_16295 [Candidatus Thorarchaeota archaeon]|nr:hypothetical protein [Candidatus Thorarchaeota archaeon]